MAPAQGAPQQADQADDGHLTLLAALVLVAVAACTLAGAAWDAWRRQMVAKPQAAERSVPGWAVGMLVSSYALLIPGLGVHLFSSSTDVVFFGVVQNMSAYDETMLSLIARLGHDKMYAGAVLVTLYAVAIPLLKVVLLLLGQCLRAQHTIWARRCIAVVQGISKWACPDMFAYILLTCLMRGLNNPPKLRSGMTLDLGFTCFSVFCVASTVSSLGLRRPELPARDAAAASASRRRCRVGPRVAAAAVLALALVFLSAFAIGVIRPSMSLRMDMQLLYKVRPDLKAMAPFMESLHLGDLLQKTVSVGECIVSLTDWARAGEVNALIALVLYAGFAVTLPVVDMALMMCVALAGLRADAALERWSASALAMSRKLRKLSMLDVSVVGSFVVVASLASLREKGVVVDVRSGAAALLVAEASRYAAAAIVHRTDSFSGSSSGGGDLKASGGGRSSEDLKAARDCSSRGELSTGGDGGGETADAV